MDQLKETVLLHPDRKIFWGQDSCLQKSQRAMLWKKATAIWSGVGDPAENSP